MLSVSLGPVALPVGALLVGAAVLAGAWVARRLAGAPQAAAADAVVWAAAVSGLVAARGMHLALNAAAYAAQPLAMIDLRDGGWHAPAGWAAALGVAAWRAHRAPALRRALAGAAAVALLPWGAAQWALQSGEPMHAAAPALAVPLVALDDGRSALLADLVRGRPAVVNLWASWCGPCRAEMPMLADAQAREADVAFVFVNAGEPAAAARAYLQGDLARLRNVWLDGRARLGPAVGSAGLPTTLFFDASGRLDDAHFGVLNDAALRARLARLRSR